MQTLKNLRQLTTFLNNLIIINNLISRDRGVKVELGIPGDLWDTPSAEITNLKKHVSTKLITKFNS